MVGLQFAARHPDRLACLLAISGADRAHPYSSAWRALQRRIAVLGRSEGGCREALSLARQLAMLSYRTPEEFAERFSAPTGLVDGRLRCAAEDYLDACGASYVAKTPLTAFLRLSESIDLHEVAPETIAVPTVLVAIEEDRLVPSQSLVDLAERLPVVRRLHLLRSRYGHDAFLKEAQAIGEIIRATLDECSGAAA
jgi:homoserine O-acetyltransferase